MFITIRATVDSVHWSIRSTETGTWTAGRIGFIIIVSVIYGMWFNAIDTVSYCTNPSDMNSCISIGKIFGGNERYQLWNIIGHCIPTLLLVLFYPKKFELFVAAFLISTVTMDSPLWGIIRLQFDHGTLWAYDSAGNKIYTHNFGEWIRSYYNPVGLYQVWDESWLFNGFPNAATIFWSLVGRSAGAILLIWWQNKQELEHKEFSLLGRLKSFKTK